MSFRRRSTELWAIALLLMASCRSSLPPGQPVEPLTATSPDDALRELRQRRDSFRGARSIMRVRATVKGESRSFRGQLQVDNREDARLIVYTPIGTTAVTVVGHGDQVTIEGPGQRVVGSSKDLASSIGLFAGNLTLAELGLLILGLPPRDDLVYEATQTGLSRAVAGDLIATFDPPVFPPTRVILTRGQDRAEIDHEEIVSK